METQEAPAGSASMTSEAYDLLDCFEDEIGDLVRALAAHHAHQRAADDPNPVIGVEEMRLAVRMFSDVIRKALQEGEMPEEKFLELEGMLDCFNRSSDG